MHSLDGCYTSFMPILSKQLHEYVTFLDSKIKGRHLSRCLLFAHNTIFFHLSGEEYHRLSLVLDDSNPRIYPSINDISLKSEESPFFLALKKDLANSYINSFSQLGDDRILAISLTIINSVYKEEGRTLIFELLPHHSNLLLLDENNKIFALYHESPLSEKRPLLKGLTYQLPEKNFVDKEEPPFNLTDYLSNCQKAESSLFLTRRNDRFAPLINSLKRREKLLKRKIEAINDDIAKASSHLNDGDYGSLLYTYKDEIDLSQGKVDIDGVSFVVDPHKSLAINAEAFFKRAKKSRNAVNEGKINLQKAQTELQEVTDSLSLMACSDEAGLEDMLKQYGTKKNFKKKEIPAKGFSSSLPYFVLAPSGAKVLFGKNAKENDCLTFMIETSKDHYWLHVMGDSGAHVIIKSDSASQEDIAFASSLALLVSKKEDGEVMLAHRGEVRKGSIPGQAIVKKFTTIRVNKILPSAITALENAKRYSF